MVIAQLLDENIVRNAASSLKRNVSVPPDSIQVKVQSGIVTLNGAIGWEYQKFAAAESVRYLMGVVSVNNLITIKPKVKF
jgi:osmotically-inducible protein OsmY